MNTTGKFLNLTNKNYTNNSKAETDLIPNSNLWKQVQLDNKLLT